MRLVTGLMIMMISDFTRRLLPLMVQGRVMQEASHHHWLIITRCQQLPIRTIRKAHNLQGPGKLQNSPFRLACCELWRLTRQATRMFEMGSR